MWREERRGDVSREMELERKGKERTTRREGG